MAIRRILLGMLFLTAILLIGSLSYVGIIIFGNYTIDETNLILNEATTIYDQEGNELTKLFVENREIVDLEMIPDHVQEAFLAIEDHRFYDHTGIDFKAIGRAVYRDVITQSKAEGGSTITQQLAKHAFLSPEKSWLRKTNEVLIAINLERRYSKDDILEMYFNSIYFGHGAYGVEAAAHVYFGKSIADVSVDEGALLAALPKAPNHYSPFIDHERSKERRDLVLSTMARRGFLTAEEAVRWQGRALPTEQINIVGNRAYDPYMDLVLKEAENVYNMTEEEVLKGGYDIVVAMDSEIQQLTYDVFQNSATFPESTGDLPVQGSVVLLDNETGGVIAVQGGRDYERKGFHRAEARRSPGSLLKPIAVYAPAMEEGLLHPYSLLKNEKMTFDDYTPSNNDNEYTVEMTMYDAIKDSANVPAVWTLDHLSIQTAKNYLAKQEMEIEDEGLSIALGGLQDGLTPLEIAGAYRTLANQGMYSEPYFIEKITDRNGHDVLRHEVEDVQIYSPQTAWNMTKMLLAVTEEGTGSAGDYQGDIAGKTGTTSFEQVSGAARDLWFAGYTPDISGVVWMGYDQSDESHYLNSSSAVPTKAFKAIMSEIADDRPTTQLTFSLPKNVDDLADPIRFVDIVDLNAKVSPGLMGSRVQLEWSGSEDDRLHYRIYEENEGETRFIDEVVGESSYTLQGVSMFSSTNYLVVPYNPLTDREGPSSNIAEGKFSIFSYN
ncbi:PBP1A family penicillin-binding protein [Bacillus sp. A301a_S52]|nr:PBP1A family penicillin-binding protein [Bacillus sp. A301a_S52]